jgi:hypothetical protein
MYNEKFKDIRFGSDGYRIEEKTLYKTLSFETDNHKYEYVLKYTADHKSPFAPLIISVGLLEKVNTGTSIPLFLLFVSKNGNIEKESMQEIDFSPSSYRWILKTNKKVNINLNNISVNFKDRSLIGALGIPLSSSGHEEVINSFERNPLDNTFTFTLVIALKQKGLFSKPFLKFIDFPITTKGTF